MKLLIYITNNTQHVYPILASMLEQHIGGATVVDCVGQAAAGRRPRLLYRRYPIKHAESRFFRLSARFP